MPLGRNIVANYVGAAWVAILSLIFTPLYLRFLGIEAYALIGFYALLSSLMGFLDFGLGTTLSRELARLSADPGIGERQRNLARTLEIIYWALAILAGAVVIIAAPYLATRWLNPQALSQSTMLTAIRLMSLTVTMQFLSCFYQGGLVGVQRQDLLNTVLISMGTLRHTGAVLLLWLVSPTINAFLIWQLITISLGTGVLGIVMWSSLPKSNATPKFSRGLLSDVWKYSATIFVNAVLALILTQLDKVILSRMLSLKMFGYYSLAATAASVVWMVITPLNSATFPRFAQLHELRRNEDLCRLFHRSTQALSTVLFPVCAILIIFSRQILMLWTHDLLVVENCHLIVSLLVFGTMLNGIVSIPGYSASAFGSPQFITYTNLVQVIVSLPLLLVLVYRFQGIGAGFAWILINSTAVAFLLPIYFRRYFNQEKGRWYLQDVAWPIVVAFSVCIGSQLVLRRLSDAPLPTLAWLILTAIATIATVALVSPHVRGLAYVRWNAALMAHLN